MRFDLLHMPHIRLFQHLFIGSLVKLRSLDPPPHPYASSFNENARYEYHVGSLGHTLENCKAFKHKMHDLIDSQAINIDKPHPNFKTNLMPMHACSSVNSIEDFVYQELIRKVENVKTPIGILKKQLLKHGLSLEHHLDGSDHFTNNYDVFKRSLQELMNKGIVQIRHFSKEEYVPFVDRNEKITRPPKIPCQNPRFVIPIPPKTMMVIKVASLFSL